MRPKDLNLILRTYVADGETTFHKLTSDFHVYVMACTHTDTCTHSKRMKVLKKKLLRLVDIHSQL